VPRGPLRLVTVTHFFPDHGGGLELVAGKLVDQFVRHGVIVAWFSSDTDRAPPDIGDRATHIPVRSSNMVERLTQLPFPLWSPLSLHRLWGAIGGADVVHVHEHLYPSSIVTLLLARLRRRPAVITQHMGAMGLQNGILTALYECGARALGALLFPLAAHVVFISANVRGFFGRSSDLHSRLIFNGIDTSRFTSNTQDRAASRAALGVPPDRKAVLFVGRFVRKKGLHVIRQLAQRFPRVIWMIVGSGPENPSAWGLANVHVCGRIGHEQLPAYYQAAELLLLPSSGEGFPLVVQEALCCGAGVLSTVEVANACPDAADMVRSCSTPRGDADIDEWAAALDATLADAAYLDARTARSARARAMWSWDDCAGQYLELFNTLAVRAP
jgi:glycosyltransferase involved in cell wall biosynthesis